MMRVIILNRHDLNEFPYHHWITDTKFKLFLISEESTKKTLDKKHLSFYEEVFWVSSLEQSAEADWQARDLLSNNEKSRIVITSEKDVILAGKLRTQYNIPGLDYEQSLIFRDKLRMRNFFKHHANQPDFFPISDSHKIYSASNKPDSKYIFKPRLGMSSIDIAIATDKDKLLSICNAIYKSSDPTIAPYIIEEFIEGDVYHADGIIVNGEIKFISLSKYINSCLEFESNHSSSISSVEIEEKNLRESLSKESADLLRHTGIRTPFVFHAEFIIQEGTAYLCEIACRPGGGKIREMIRYKTKIDLDKEYVSMQIDPENYKLIIRKPIEKEIYGYFSSRHKLREEDLNSANIKILEFSSSKTTDKNSKRKTSIIASAQSSKILTDAFKNFKTLSN